MEEMKTHNYLYNMVSTTCKYNYTHISKTRGINQNVNSDETVGDFYFIK